MQLREVDQTIRDAVFAADRETRQKCSGRILESASELGIYSASIQGLYEAAGKGQYQGITVPAVNIRGMTYEVARAMFRAAAQAKAGAVIFEIARSEIGYTKQKPGEYAACVMAAAIRENYRGPVFLQGDHYQINLKKFQADAGSEMAAVKDLIRESIAAGFYNIDIDASTLVDLEKPTLEEQQDNNCRVTAELTQFIRELEPAGTVISVGGEIGEVGGRNSTVEDLRAFMSGYRRVLSSGMVGISKISVQTGTTHGGVVLPDGTIADVELDFETLGELSRVARGEFGLAGAVQHGASTLPEEAFDHFTRVGAAEVHLATGFQNIIYESPFFPRELMASINTHLLENYAGERGAKDSDGQFLYKTRKKAFGDFKKEIWDLPQESIDAIGKALEDRFLLLFRKLNVVDTMDLVKRFVATS